jgi:hypothetical protein
MRDAHVRVRFLHAQYLGHSLYSGPCCLTATEPTICHWGDPIDARLSQHKASRRHRQASVVSLLTEDSEDGTLLDLSRKGARLRINHLFQRGQKLTLMLNLPWEEPPVQVRLAAVKWVQQDTVGVEFLKVEADDRVSLDVFLASRSKHQAGSPA